MLSRGGIELNEIWRRQAQLVEHDEDLRRLERAYQSAPNDETVRERLVSTYRRKGDHDSADAVHLGHHARVFADASKRAHEAEKAVQAHYDPGRRRDPDSLTKAEHEWDKAHEAMEDAHGALTRHTGEALRARGDDNPMNKAKRVSTRYRVLTAHAAKHLPPTKNWEQEHSLLSHWHGAYQPGRAARGGFQHMRVESRAARHALVHSLVTRNPHLRITHNETEDGHHVMVQLAPRSREPLHTQGGHVSEIEGAATTHANTKNYLSMHPPHGKD